MADELPFEMTAELLAHRDFSAVLDSFKRAWELRKRQHDEDLKRINDEIDKQLAAALPLPTADHVIRDKRAAIASKFHEDLERHRSALNTLDRRIAGASNHGILMITRGEMDAKEADRLMLPTALMRMAALVERAEIIEAETK